MATARRSQICKNLIRHPLFNKVPLLTNPKNELDLTVYNISCLINLAGRQWQPHDARKFV
ncbi:hypothetical protein C2869_01680 [Saccharobesus litoralis]|uniref:Uncharacterized protein n=1 Tax=Saccharobesus litoralis TaxID=2172099 RepID=A0A2S0VM27_9ALTE|nr:hypothetical protein C2869_01680 [Saccharobesus litoralis]